MKIGGVSIPEYAAVAPMAGVADAAFRSVCRSMGAGFSVSEMVSAKALVYQSNRTEPLLMPGPGEEPFAVQIFGSDAQVMAQAALIALEKSKAQILDINMGCPTPKIVSNGDGSALMLDLPRAFDIISAVAGAVTVPVTVKFRLGWDKNSVCACEFARMAQSAGASAICVHGRTREQMYSGRADWDELARVRECVDIPFVANGDVFSAADAQTLYERTGADYIMVGRGCLGDPWIFQRINARMKGLPEPALPDIEQRLHTAQKQIELASRIKGEHIAVLEARKHLAWYLKSVRGSAPYRARFSSVSDLDGMRAVIAEFLERRPDLG